MKLFIVFILAFMQVAFAHFELLYPPTRGFNEDTESTTPCGGANTVGNRTQMPLSNAFVQIYSSHPVYQYGIYIVAKNNPSAADFNTNLTTIGSGGRNYPEAACLPLNLNLDPGITAGTNATLQVQYNGGDSILYQVYLIWLSSDSIHISCSAQT
ncbi:uncharacterized protein B0P05DRAFT_559236 [Gilbertella persicaria]|uniref:uncharacterized protein n=1 Tax=Gilbertella persicaria TaxID=101096 RepID=UPI00221F21D3|nr:uncharacterized protein B0P05DRAFT_559236 [Gilbertella persicaria]KAI8058978.1 hypothetical protein B0P05DRAFT_559236 [Gilbertella persicaria]